MGLLKGTGSLTRYRVQGTPPENYPEEYAEAIARYAFQRIDDNSTDDRSSGWVNILDMFDSRFARMDFLKEPWIAMSMRVDVKRVPPGALEQYSKEAEEEVKASEELEILPKHRRREIRDAMRIKLIKRAIPVSNTYEMIWNLETGAVIFGSANNKLCDEFAGLFLRTFDLHLYPIFPYLLGWETLEKEGMDPNILENLAPAKFSQEE